VDHDSLYDTDICSWAEQQAAALRSLASKTDLPNQLDLPNIIEEIEDVGISHLDSVSSFIRLILSHAILIALDPDAASVSHWTAEAATFHGELMQRYQRSMRQRVNMDLLWRRALREAGLKLRAYRRANGLVMNETGAEKLDVACPFSVEQICDERFDVDVVVEELKEALIPAS
jgi:hypothetical protein